MRGHGDLKTSNKNWKNAHFGLSSLRQDGDPGKHGAVILREHVLESMPIRMERQQGTGSRQHGFYHRQVVPHPAWVPAVMNSLGLWAREGEGKLFAWAHKGLARPLKQIL